MIKKNLTILGEQDVGKPISKREQYNPVGMKNHNNVLAYVEVERYQKYNIGMSRLRATKLACEKVEGSFYNTVYVRCKDLKERARELGLLRNL